MDIAKSLVFMFDDTDWLRKLAIGTLVALLALALSPFLIGIVPFIVLLGYALDVTTNVMEGRVNPLPAWEDWSRLLMRGFKIGVVLIIWWLPFLVLSTPLWIGSALSGSRDMSFLAALAYACGSCLTLIWLIFFVIALPAIWTRVARTDSFVAGFELGELWATTRASLANVIIAALVLVVVLVVATVFAGLGVIALVIGLIVTVPFALFWLVLVMAHLYGQIDAQRTAVA